MPLFRLQNSYTASQRTNQDLEEKLHALVTDLLSLWGEEVGKSCMLGGREGTLAYRAGIAAADGFGSGHDPPQA